jgi:hypothetical protein
MKAGFWFGYGTGSMNFVLGGLQLIQSWLAMNDPVQVSFDVTGTPVITGGTDPRDLSQAFFIILFGVMTAGSMGAMAPDAAAATTAGTKIFKIVDTPTKVDAVNEEVNEKLIKTDP